MKVYEENIHEINYQQGKRLLEKSFRQSKRIYDQGFTKSQFSDFDSFTEESPDIELISSLFVEKIIEINNSKEVDCLYFLDKEGKSTVGAIKIAGILSYFTGIPNFIIRLDHDIITKKLKISTKEKSDLIYSGILIVDHISSGTEILEGVKIVETFRKVISDVISFTMLSREFKRKNELELKGITIHGLYYLNLEEKKVY